MNTPHVPERLLRLNEVRSLTGMSRATVYRRASLPSDDPEKFPQWIKLGRMSAWSAHEVADWIERQKARRSVA